MLMTSDQCVLVVVDVQEKLAPAIAGIDGVLNAAQCLIEAAELLGVPIVVTEHCPDRIGATVPVLSGAVQAGSVLSKVHFNAMEEDHCRVHFETLKRRCAVVCGTEAHVCVIQTAFGLKSNGLECFVVADAVGSRKRHDRDTAMARMAAAGMSIVTAEMVLFEWLARGDTSEFRQLLPMIKALQTGAAAG